MSVNVLRQLAQACGRSFRSEQASVKKTHRARASSGRDSLDGGLPGQRDGDGGRNAADVSRQHNGRTSLDLANLAKDVKVGAPVTRRETVRKSGQTARESEAGNQDHEAVVTSLCGDLALQEEQFMAKAKQIISEGQSNSEVRQKLHLLLDAAQERSGDERSAIYSAIIDRLLSEGASASPRPLGPENGHDAVRGLQKLSTRDAEKSAASFRSTAETTRRTAHQLATLKDSGTEAKQSSAQREASLKAQLLSESGKKMRKIADKAIEVRSNQRKPHKAKPSEPANVSARPPVGEACLELMNVFGISDEDTRSDLIELARSVITRENKGIPPTEHNSYKLLTRGGPAPKPRFYGVDGKVYKIAPPMMLMDTPHSRQTYAAWTAFEKMLLDVKDSGKPDLSLEKKIISSESFAKSHTRWTEASIMDGSLGIPTIAAQTARNILSDVVNEKKYGPKFLAEGPLSWCAPGTLKWTSAFASFARDVVLGKVSLDRVHRFALARLMMTPLGELELELFRAGFPDRSNLVNMRDEDFAQYESEAKKAGFEPSWRRRK